MIVAGSSAERATPKSVMMARPRAVDHHVRRFQIEVQNAAFVRGGEPRAELVCDVERLFADERSHALQQTLKILALDELH